MRSFIVKYRKLWFMLFLFSFCFYLAGCSTAWTSEASTIIALLGPAIQAALGILTAFGLGLAPNVMTEFQSWATQTQNALTNVIKPLIDQYNAAEAGAKPGILAEIQAALSVISGGLGKILPTIHVTDPGTQQRITAVITAIADEISALIGLVPALQGNVSTHAELKALMNKLKGPDEFKADFNSKTASFGSEYAI